MVQGASGSSQYQSEFENETSGLSSSGDRVDCWDGGLPNLLGMRLPCNSSLYENPSVGAGEPIRELTQIIHGCVAVFARTLFSYRRYGHVLANVATAVCDPFAGLVNNPD